MSDLVGQQIHWMSQIVDLASGWPSSADDALGPQVGHLHDRVENRRVGTVPRVHNIPVQDEEVGQPSRRDPAQLILVKRSV